MDREKRNIEFPIEPDKTGKIQIPKGIQTNGMSLAELILRCRRYPRQTRQLTNQHVLDLDSRNALVQYIAATSNGVWPGIRFEDLAASTQVALTKRFTDRYYSSLAAIGLLEEMDSEGLIDQVSMMNIRGHFDQQLRGVNGEDVSEQAPIDEILKSLGAAMQHTTKSD